MNEINIFWKINSNATLATQKLSNNKTEKTQITINFIYNVIETKKLSSWIIKKTKKSRCFQDINIINLFIVWRWNIKTWIINRIFKEFLLWFDSQMSDRKSILLINNFSAHHAGLNLIETEFTNSLSSIKIIFLFTNATSLCQPLDQNIIRIWKAYYKKQWLRYQISEYKVDRIFEKTVNVLKAIRWSMSIWDEVSSSTIHNCWLKTRVLKPKYDSQSQSKTFIIEWKATL